MKKKRHYPPSYYKYREEHPTVGVSINKELKAILEKLREKMYLFSLDINYRQYLNRTTVVKNLTNAFGKNSISISDKAKIEKVNDRIWHIKDRTKEFILEDFKTNLKVYEKMSYSRLIAHILEDNIDHFKAYKAEYRKGYREGVKKYRILFECVNCNEKMPVIPNSEVHRQIIEMLKTKGWSHGNCHNKYQRGDKSGSE